MALDLPPPERPTVAFEKKLAELDQRQEESVREHARANARLKRASQECRKAADTGRTRLAMRAAEIDSKEAP